jgi:hypothetical protein
MGQPPRFEFVEAGKINRWVRHGAEILKDGGPLHEWEDHFYFGPREAEIFITALPIIKRFAEETTPGRISPICDQTTLSRPWGFRVEANAAFGFSVPGRYIRQPYLKLRRSDVRERLTTAPIGDVARADANIGITKCLALIAVAKDIENWVVNVLGNSPVRYVSTEAYKSVKTVKGYQN